MKTGLNIYTQSGIDFCNRKTSSQSDTTITALDHSTSTWLSGNRKPLNQLIGKKLARSAMTLSALYFCVACGAEGLEDGTQRFGVTATIEPLPTTDEAIPTSNLDENPFVTGEVTVQPGEEANVQAEIVVVAGAGGDSGSSDESSPTLGAAAPEEEVPVTVVTDTDPVVDPRNIPVFKNDIGPLAPGANVVGVDYPDANTMWQVDFWVGDEIVNQQNPDGVDQGPSVRQSEGIDSYTVNIPGGITEIKLYVRYWVEGTPFPTTWVAGENFIETTVSVSAGDTDNATNEPASTPEASAASPVAASSGGGRTSSFAEIQNDGLDNACYLDDDHYVAEFLHQNPDACFWELDSNNRTVTAVDTPTPPSDAVQLPAPSGSDDTAALESFINARAGESLVGRGTYKVAGLDINVPVDIFNMPMEPASGAGVMVHINSPDVRIFSSPIDAKNMSSVYIGFNVVDGSHRFTLVDSGFSNMLHKRNENGAGVYLRGVDDFHLACNTFVNILNDTNDKSKTARANSIWMNGRNTESTSGGYIVNNYAENAQSNGKLKDSEFFTQQSYASTSVDEPTRIFGNRTMDAGKRFTKHQTDNAMVLSNDHEWSVKNGDLGSRLLLSHVTVQFSDNIIARNNRVTVGADSRFDYIFITQVHYGTQVQDNIHYDCNDIEIQDQLPASSNNIPILFTARMPTKPADSTGFEATNSSASFNRVHGDGSVRYFYNFDQGYNDRGGRFATDSNVFEIDNLNSIYK